MWGSSSRERIDPLPGIGIEFERDLSNVPRYEEADLPGSQSMIAHPALIRQMMSDVRSRAGALHLDIIDDLLAETVMACGALGSGSSWGHGFFFTPLSFSPARDIPGTPTNA